MSKKKSVDVSNSGGLPALKIGSRVRCTDDGVEGRIVWCNAVSVKVRWDDGEQVTWRRDSLADRPIEILATAGDEEQQIAPSGPAAPEQAIPESPVEPAAAEPIPVKQPVEPPLAETITIPAAVATEQTVTAEKQAEEAPPSKVVQEVQTTPEQTQDQTEQPSAAAPPSRRRKPKQAAEDGEGKKLSALDAAAKVLAETCTPMGCTEMIGAMAARGYWTSPGGKTPAATLYSAMFREIATKGTHSRFVKADRGKFALAASAV
jgi:outer membrane biosynthesis protein TonB